MLGLGHGAQTDTVGLAEIFSNNYSLGFDGDDQAVQIDNLADDLSISAGTYSTWIKCGEMDSSRTILGVFNDSNNFVRLWWYHSLNQFSVTYKRGGNASRADANTGSGVLGDGDWHHLAATWDVGENELKIYHNGQLLDGDATTTINSSASMSTLDKADIGKSSTDAAYWQGHIDEVSVFDEVVDISVLYNSGSPKDVEFSSLSGLIGYWRFTEGSGTSAVDESGKGNTGTLENAPSWSGTTP